MEDYAKQSFWLETCGDDLTPRRPIRHSTKVDVAVVGGGYSGLWTAYYLLKTNPKLSVAVLEDQICGYGASGRNGGGCGGRLANQARLLATLAPADAETLEEVQQGVVPEIASFLEQEGVEADFQRSGSLSVAVGSHQLAALERRASALLARNPNGPAQLLSAPVLERRVRISGAVGALFDPSGAVVHPGKLVRGLARTAERRGAVIFEKSRVTRLELGRQPVVHLGQIQVRAGTVVLAVEGYLNRLPGFRRVLIPMTSSIVLTRPLSDGEWAEIGWAGRETISSYRLSVTYLQRTADGRIMFGGRGAPYRYGSRVLPDHNSSGRIFEMLRTMARAWFPVLRGVEFTHAWSGVLGVPRDLTPAVRYRPQLGLLQLGGYVGTGVGPSNLFGRVAAALLLNSEPRLERLPLVGHGWRPWEPEPLRWAGVRYVQRGLLGADRRAERSGRAPSGRTLAERLWAQ